jgi:hypothetical protein
MIRHSKADEEVATSVAYLCRERFSERPNLSYGLRA